MLTFTSKSGRTSVKISEAEYAKLVAQFSRRTRGGSETPEAAARGWLLTDASRRADWQQRIAEFQEPTAGQIDTEARRIAFECYTYEALTEPGGCHYNVSQVLMRANGGHRMSEGMQADFVAAQASASRMLRERGVTPEHISAARSQLCIDRDYCAIRLGVSV